MSVQRLISEVRVKHVADPGVAAAEVAAFSAGKGFSLPHDMEEFYLSINGARLFVGDFPLYRLMPLAEIDVAAKFIFPPGYEIDSPKSWFAFCDDCDGNYVAADLATVDGDRCQMIDCFHESFPDPDDCRPIAGSFTEFLERLLEAGGRAFWLA